VITKRNYFSCIFAAEKSTWS